MAKLKIYSDIVGEEDKMFLAWNGIDSTAFTDVDAFIGSVPEEDEAIDLQINCRGGRTDVALAMYDALRATGKVISAEVIGECSSSATLLLLAARKDLRRAHPNASILIHNPYICGFVEGDSKRVGAIAESLNDVRERFLDIYVERTGAPREVLSSMMDEDKPMTVAKAIELGFITEEIPPISAARKTHNTTHSMNFKNFFKALRGLMDSYGMDLTTADGGTLELVKESGDPAVGDEVISEDGEYLMPDGTTIVVEGSVIVEIRPAAEEVEEPAAPEEGAERGEETQTEEADGSEAEKERLKAELAEKDAIIEELKKQLEESRSKAKSDDERAILDMVAVAGGREWLENVKSKATVQPREFNGGAEKAQARREGKTFAEYISEKRNNKTQK